MIGHYTMSARWYWVAESNTTGQWPSHMLYTTICFEKPQKKRITCQNQLFIRFGAPGNLVCDLQLSLTGNLFQKVLTTNNSDEN